MRSELARVLVAIAGGLATVSAVAGNVTSEDEHQIARRLADHPECCIIDARGELARLRAQIPFAVVLGPLVRVKKDAVALLVADSDAAALKAAREVADRSSGDVVAVKGGHRTLLALGRAASSDAAAGSHFTIPSNTCEHGPPLQEFRR